VKSPYKNQQLVIPTWYAVTNVNRLILRPNAVLVGKNILLQNIDVIPELPTGILRLATLSPNESHAETFYLANTRVNVVRYKAFDSVYLKDSFVINNVTLESIEEGAFNVSIPQGNFSVSLQKYMYSNFVMYSI
jgi:hypothetical protein